MDIELVWKFLGVKPAAIPIWGFYYKVLCTLTSPEDKMLFMYSKKPSSLISLSVKMKVIPLPCWPAVRYRNFRSSSKLLTLYDLQHKTKCIYSHAHLSWTTTCKSLGFTLLWATVSFVNNTKCVSGSVLHNVASMWSTDMYNVIKLLSKLWSHALI